MKKIPALILCLCLILSLCACDTGKAPQAPVQEPSEAYAAREAAEPGMVYYLNPYMEDDGAWQELAALYTEQTGVEVRVLSVPEGEYQETLQRELNLVHAPGIFSCELKDTQCWEDFCLDLNSSGLVEMSLYPDFSIKNAFGSTIYLPYSVSSYALLVNRSLLETAGYRVDSIIDFASLKPIADDIHARAMYFNFDAFAPAPLGDSAERFTAMLASLPLYYEFRDQGRSSAPENISGKYGESFKALWELYTLDSSVLPEELSGVSLAQSEKEFAEGKAVFCLADSEAYERLSQAMDMKNISILPVFSGIEGERRAGLCTGPGRFWAVNSESSRKDIQACLDFLRWLISSEEGCSMLTECFGCGVFDNDAHSENGLEAQATAYLSEGRYPVMPAACYAPEGWLSQLTEALSAYTAGSGSWDSVSGILISAWGGSAESAPSSEAAETIEAEPAAPESNESAAPESGEAPAPEG